MLLSTLIPSNSDTMARLCIFIGMHSEGDHYPQNMSSISLVTEAHLCWKNHLCLPPMKLSTDVFLCNFKVHDYLVKPIVTNGSVYSLTFSYFSKYNAQPCTLPKVLPAVKISLQYTPSELCKTDTTMLRLSTSEWCLYSVQNHLQTRT